MIGVTTLSQGRSDSSSSETHHTSASKVEDVNHRVRYMIALGLAFEVAFLAALAAYELSSIFRFQN